MTASVRGRARTDRASAALGVLYVVIGAAVATAIAWPIFETPRLVLVAGVAVALGCGIPVLLRASRAPAWSVPIALAIGYVLAAPPVAIPRAFASPRDYAIATRDAITGIVLGGKQALTLRLPLEDYQAVLVLPFLVLYLGTAVAVLLVLSRGRGAALAVPVVGAMAVFGIAFGPSDDGAALAIGALRIPDAREAGLVLGLLLVSLAWLVLRARRARRAALRAARGVTTVRVRAGSPWPGLRRGAVATALVVGALVVGVLAAPGAAELTARRTLRDGVEPRLVLAAQSSPLAAYRGWFAGAAYDRPIFTVDAPAGIDRLRIATLDRYDGEDFTVSEQGEGGRFVRLPRTQGSAAARDVRVRIESGWRSVWMPVPDGLDAAPVFRGARSAALADGFYLSDSTGTAIEVAAGSGRGLRAGDGYTASAVPSPDAALAERGGAPTIDGDDYPRLAAWVERQEQPRTAAGLAELIDRLRARGYLSHALDDDADAADWVAALTARAPYAFQPSYAGHSAARIEDLFGRLDDQERRAGSDPAQGALVAGVGDDEQFATAGALLARYLGYESRVVEGVRLRADPDSGVPSCARTCTGANIAAWIEVRAPGSSEWTTLDTSPQFRTPPVLLQEGQRPPRNPTVPELPSAGSADPPAAPRDAGDATPAHRPAPPGLWERLLPVLRTVGLVALAALLLVLPAIVIVSAKAVRRRRRRRGPPEVAVLGAWDELADTYADRGIDTSGPTRRAAAERSGRPDARTLAALCDAVVFGATAPAAADADAAWQLVRRERIALSARSGGGERMRAAVSPVSFLRRAGATSASLGAASGPPAAARRRREGLA